MDENNEPGKTPEMVEIERLQIAVALCRAEVLAQNAMIKALIATHLGADVVMDAFAQYSERSVSGALASTVEDGSISAFEQFRDFWLDWIRPHAEDAKRRAPGG
ncbi:hypothetical protein ADM96_20230 [Burkholderia sp. ST111]|nr:hypothetical protein ADM96_20230 [Burkholderia sp. ST111]